MSLAELFLLWNTQLALKRLLYFAYEEYRLLDAEKKGKEAVKRKIEMYEEMIVQEQKKEKETVEKAFKQLTEWRKNEEKSEGKVGRKEALVWECSEGKERKERTGVKGEERIQGARGSTVEGAQDAGTSVQSKSSVLLSSFSSWYCECKKKTE